MAEEEQKEMEVHQRLEIIGTQMTIDGKKIPITQFKNLEEKRKLKEQVKALFNGEIVRSIITPKDIDGNKRLDKIERQVQTGDRSSDNNTIERADAYGKKSFETLSTFPSLITSSYAALLSKEGDWVLDLFMGHNSRASDILAMNRKYVGFDVHTFPVEFTRNACSIFSQEDFNLHQMSSEKIPYPDERFDFGLTCPPYYDVEEYNVAYKEVRQDDLSSKDYENFLWIYNNCLGEGFRTLKQGKFFVVVVGDKQKDAKLQSLALDTIKICKLHGFELHDINIYNRKSNIGGDLNFKVFVNTCKRFPCIHEYILIFYKPYICTKCKKKLMFRKELDLDEKMYCSTCYNMESKNRDRSD